MKYPKKLKFPKPRLDMEKLKRRLSALKTRRVVFGMLAVCLVISTAYAARTPISGSADARVKKVTYHENDVYRLEGHYGYTTVVEFGDKERIETISLGDSEAWQVVKPHRDNLLFVKPLEQNAATNMTVITSDHIYSFELSAEKAESNEVSDLTFRLKFTYANTGNSKGLMTFKGDDPKPLSSVSPDAWNFDYTYTGDNALRPQRVFDDGKFTYFQFDNIGVMPAVFRVDDKGKESIVNSSVHGSSLVVHRTAAQFKLRDGGMETTVFNEAWPKETGKERDIVPVTALKEKKSKAAKKKKRSSDNFFASFTPDEKPPVYNR